MNRRKFNQSLFAAAWAGSFAATGAFAAGSRSMARIESDLDAITRLGAETTVPKAALKEFQAALRGSMILPGHDEYDTARKVWNGMIDKKPGLVARCSGPADVIRAVEFAREFDLLIAVRGGGHSISGKSTCDGGIVIDLSPMRWCTVDPIAQTARLGAGSHLGDLDHETLKFGLATPTGTVSHTGAAGLTLGGGHGRLSRSFGLTCDNVKSVDIVMADGKFRRASADENPDLYWGIRGGGGNFGIVTAFEYTLHRIDPIVYGGAMLYPIKSAKNVFDVFAEFTASAPREMAADVIALRPPGGKGFVALSICHIGDHAEAEKLLAPIRQVMKPMVDQAKPMRYADLQRSADNNTPWGRLYYNKSGLMPSLEPAFLETIVDRMANSGGGEDGAVASNVIVQHLGGAVGDVAPEDTAYVHREARYDSVILSAWDNPEFNEPNIRWLKDSFAEMEPFTTGFYSNHMVDSDQPKLKRAFRGNYDRLAALKKKFDPDNAFQLNPNIKPA